VQYGGDTTLLIDLLNGVGFENPSDKRFFVLNPGTVLKPSYDSNVFMDYRFGVLSGNNKDGKKGHDYEKGCTLIEGVNINNVKKSYESRDTGNTLRKKSNKRYGLGIDAGGTYTDSVIFDFEKSRVVEYGKAPTTHHNYSIGIKNSLGNLFRKLSASIIDEVSIVSVSTTIATNAIIENKGGLVGMLLIGFDNYNEKKLRYQPIINIKGKCSVNGEIIEDVSELEVLEVGKKLVDEGVEVIGIVSEIGPRYPTFELKAKEILEANFKLPVVASLDISDDLNCVKRANTCYLNAKLIPLVRSLLISLKNVLSSYDLDAPIMIVKGDGSLMNEATALTNPVEMVLSGPAASVIGGIYLSNLRDALVVDIGGTSMDVSLVKNGEPLYRVEGIDLKGFRTSVRTIDISTYGLGCDSHIRIDRRSGEVKIGPKRVMPICYSSSLYTEVKEVLKKLKEPSIGDRILNEPVEFVIYQKTKDEEISWLTDYELRILEVLSKRKIIEITELAREISLISALLIDLDRLESSGFIIRSSLTMTDLLHANGKVKIWNTEAAKRSLDLYSKRMKISRDDFTLLVEKSFYRNFYLNILRYVFNSQSLSGKIRYAYDKFISVDLIADFLTSNVYEDRDIININIRMGVPIVLIGAPASTFKKPLSDILNGEIVVPQFHEVANAVGAIVGMVVEKVNILIRESPEGKFIAFTPWGLETYDNLNLAKEEVRSLAEDYVIKKVSDSGGSRIKTEVVIRDRRAKISTNDEIYIETEVIAKAFGIPDSRCKVYHE